MTQVRIHFTTADVTVEVPQGSTLLEAARKAGVAVDAACGGIGRCGRCRVIASGGTSPLTEDESALLPADDIAAGVRFACRARVTGDVTVTSAPPIGRIRVTERSVLPRPEVEPPAARGIVAEDSEEPLLGVAVDVGTTTLALVLVDLRNGDEIAHGSALNPQSTYGADVLSRVSSALAGNAAALQAAVVEEIERLALSMVETVGVAPGCVREFAIIGNTAMRALLLAEDVSPLSGAPYEGVPTSTVATDTGTLGMRAFDTPVLVGPGVSAFIGGDVVAGVSAAGIAGQGEPVLYLDLGTNGESVLVSGERIFAASAAAGPALEGAGISAGMRAEPGAIERVRLHGTALIAETIDAAPPRGICGSGLLDLVAVLLETGVLDDSGRLRDDASHPLVARVAERGDQRVFVVDEELDILLTQRDVRELQLAKGAVRTALDMLLEAGGMPVASVADVVVAGGFGLHVRAESLARIGMIPAEWIARVRFVGNAALSGANGMLLSARARKRASAIASAVETIDLAGDPGFQPRFLSSLEFPQAR